MKRIVLATMVSTVLFVAQAHAQNVILNGSFELPSIPANSDLETTPVSWLGENRPLIFNGDLGPEYALPQDGQQYVHLGHFPFEPQAASLSQAFTISSPGTYLLNWYDSSFFSGPNGSSPYSVIVSDGAANVVTAANFDANATALRVWTQRSIALALAPDTYTLRFQGLVAASGSGSDIDNVSLSLDVPEPSTLLLLGLTAAGTLVRRRR